MEDFQSFVLNEVIVPDEKDNLLAKSMIKFVYIDSVLLKGGGGERRKFLDHLVLFTCQVVYAVSEAVLWNGQGWCGPKRLLVGKKSQGVCHSGLEGVCYIVLIFCMHD